MRRARAVTPGGVSSPVRAFGGVGGDPFVVEHGEGARIWDVDGTEYIDYVMSWGALALGHAAPAVLDAVSAAMARGTSFGIPCEAETELAEAIARRMPHVEKLRFVSSGTEATMSAIRLARAATGRDAILKFDGCYHGHADSFLVRAGSGVATLGLPNSPGVPSALAALTVTAPFNDVESTRAVARQVGHDLAAIIVEPVVGNAGFIPPVADFLPALRTIADETGALLIFDEVMTGFRIASGGAVERFGVRPDLTSLGKVIGGGLPVAAYGGRQDVMELIAPQGPVYQAGTLSGNPLAMAAGLATLRHLKQHPEIYNQLEQRASALVDGILNAAKKRGIDLTANRVGSMFTWFFQRGAVHDWDTAAKSDTQAFAKFHRGMLDRGIYLPPSQYEAAFLGAAHSEDDIRRTIEAAGLAF